MHWFLLSAFLFLKGWSLPFVVSFFHSQAFKFCPYSFYIPSGCSADAIVNINYKNSPLLCGKFRYVLLQNIFLISAVRGLLLESRRSQSVSVWGAILRAHKWVMILTRPLCFIVFMDRVYQLFYNFCLEDILPCNWIWFGVEFVEYEGARCVGSEIGPKLSICTGTSQLAKSTLLPFPELIEIQ